VLLNVTVSVELVTPLMVSITVSVLLEPLALVLIPPVFSKE